MIVWVPQQMSCGNHMIMVRVVAPPGQHGQNGHQQALDGARAPVAGGTAGAGANPGRRRPHQLNAGLPPGGIRGRAGSSPWMAAVHGSDRGPGGNA